MKTSKKLLKPTKKEAQDFVNSLPYTEKVYTIFDINPRKNIYLVPEETKERWKNVVYYTLWERFKMFITNKKDI